jgi:putative transposase
VKKKRFAEQQIYGFLKEAEAGVAVKELCRKQWFQRCSVVSRRAMGRLAAFRH